jgi:hypothetical protein
LPGEEPITYRGTSLPDVDPRDLEKELLQCGLGFAMSKQLSELLQGHYSSEKAMPVDCGGDPEWFVEKVLEIPGWRVAS